MKRIIETFPRRYAVAHVALSCALGVFACTSNDHGSDASRDAGKPPQDGSAARDVRDGAPSALDSGARGEGGGVQAVRDAGAERIPAALEGGAVVRTEDTEFCAVCGGETGDFMPGGESTTPFDPCTLTPGEVNADVDAGLDVSTIAQELQGTYEVSAAWLELNAAAERPVDGYETNTSVTLQVKVGKAQYVESEPKLPEHAEYCEDFLRFATQVDVSTADGAVSGTFEGQLAQRLGGVWALRAETVANQFTGTLNLDVRAANDEVVVASLDLQLFEGQARGRLYPQIWTPQVQSSSEGANSVILSPIELRFPSDGCEMDERPLRDDELGGLTEMVQELVEVHNPLLAHHWMDLDRFDELDGGSSSAQPDPDRTTRIEIRVGDVEKGCRKRGDGSSELDYSVDAPVSIALADDWASFEHPAKIFAWGPGSGLIGARLSSLHAPRDARALERELGIDGVPLDDDECARVIVRSNYEPAESADSIQVSGGLEVVWDGCDESQADDTRQRTLAFVSWCDACDIEPRPDYLRQP